MEANETQQEQNKPDEALWRNHVAAWEKSRLSASHYCRENGIKIHQFKYWQYRLAPQTKKPCKKAKEFSTSSFIPVMLKPDKTKTEMEHSSKWAIHVGTKIRFEMAPLDMDGLKRLIQSLMEV